MELNAKQVVDRMLLEVIKSPSRQFELRGQHAHPLLLERLRAMAQMQQGSRDGTIELSVNKRPWEVLVSFIAGPRGEEAKLVARQRPAG
ncbi:MAG TPA: hypothetical protein VII92_06010 [Anaerolineae bacterium]